MQSSNPAPTRSRAFSLNDTVPSVDSRLPSTAVQSRLVLILHVANTPRTCAVPVQRRWGKSRAAYAPISQEAIDALSATHFADQRMAVMMLRRGRKADDTAVEDHGVSAPTE